MGDNRKESGDSRQDIGLIDYQDIRYVLPFQKQQGRFDKQWRIEENKEEVSFKVVFDKSKYLGFLNSKRRQEGAEELSYQTRLEASATKRAETILKFDDYASEAKRSNYPAFIALKEEGYPNFVYGEFINVGYFEAEELLEIFSRSQESQDILLNNYYQEIGIAVIEKQIDNCFKQVVVQHIVGPH